MRAQNGPEAEGNNGVAHLFMNNGLKSSLFSLQQVFSLICTVVKSKVDWLWEGMSL